MVINLLVFKYYIMGTDYPYKYLLLKITIQNDF